MKDDDFDSIIDKAHDIANLATRPKAMPGHPVISQDVQDAIDKAGSCVSAVHELIVREPADNETMGGLRVEVQTVNKALQQKRKELLEPIIESQKRIRDFFRKPIGQLESAYSVSGEKMTRYRQAIEEKERKARVESERKERAKREADIARLREKAAKEEEKGHEQTAAGLRDSAREVARAPVTAPPPKFTETKTEGTHFKKTYVAHIDTETIMRKLAAAIDNYNSAARNRADDPSKPAIMLTAEYFLVNEKLVEQTADNTKGAIPIPDVTVELVEVPITRSRKR